MDDVYLRLARRLDQPPMVFPATRSGVELKILSRIFSPEEAEIALELLPIPESVEGIARRQGKTPGEAREALDAMAERGQIGSFKLFGRQRYCFIPFVIGIYEFQLDRLDAELASLIEEYAPTLLAALGRHAPALGRVVPMHVKIDAQLEVLPHEDVRALLDQSKSFMVRECICRKERQLTGHVCMHSRETCLGLSREESAFERCAYGGRIVDRSEALETCESCEREGLVHVTFNTRSWPLFICNCCSCCCGFLRGMRELEAPHLLARSRFVAAIDASECSACSLCAAQRCPVGAIVIEGGEYRVRESRCIGCGLCATACPTGAARLVPRPGDAVAATPANPLTWVLRKSVNRLLGD